MKVHEQEERNRQKSQEEAYHLRCIRRRKEEKKERMSSNTTAQQISSVDRSQRSIFVGNISYEATEEQLKDIFSQAGPVVHFRLVFDRDTGKPKGYGFCEYTDIETAQSAIRNLNNFELHGRQLRVDSATGSERNKEEVRQLQMTLGGPAEESPFGPACEPGKAPESISRAVASLPPEQMFELMKQMKLCIQNNPNEARNMLLQNPQLAYALLQAQVVMRIVDPQVAITMLHRDTGPPPNPLGVSVPPPSGAAAAAGGGGLPPGFNLATVMGTARPPPTGAFPPMMRPGGGDIDLRQPPMGMRPPLMTQPPPQLPPQINTSQPPPPGPSQPPPAAPAGDPQEQEKAKLIMQVLQLSEEQINLLPPDQKQSVLVLREQLRSAQK